jgi:hypothetical protein
MHVRVSTKRVGAQVYRYVQLVESYRRPDGVPTQRVVGNLGQRSEQEVDNIRRALEASRGGQSVMVASAATSAVWPTRVMKNLAYLDVAVALATWERWKLRELLNGLLPQGLDAVAAADMIAVLAIQRCVAPGSKLFAQRWFPTTALPELLGIAPGQFNNVRIHRVLEELDRVDPALQQALPSRYEQKDGVFATLFLDVTDAWFHGRGCAMAERSRTKEGLKDHHKIGIVLLCNEHGYPLRWAVLPGKRHDAQCMEELLGAVQDEPWLGEAPLVCDRAMGKPSTVAKMLASGLRFITAAIRPEIPGWTDRVPYEPFLALEPTGFEPPREEEVAAAARTAGAAGMERVGERLYVLDLGVETRTLDFEQPALDVTGATWDPENLEGGAAFIALARVFQERLDRKEVRHRSALAQQLGLTRARVTQIMNSLRLDLQLQERLLRGEFGYVPERLLRQCAQVEAEEEQRRLLEENAQFVRCAPGASARHRPLRSGRQEARLRLVVYFNPDMFAEQRAVLERHRRTVQAFVQDLNERLRAPQSRLDAAGVHAAILDELARYHLARSFEIQVGRGRPEANGERPWQARLILDEESWQRRKRFAGFVLLVAHPDLPHSAAEIVRLYHAKDAIEKDFQTIKALVKLQPVYHHTDPKVRAHVTLCMLALLLERTLQRRLRRGGLDLTAAACFEQLHTACLNMVTNQPGLSPGYIATEANQDQRAILRSLRMLELIDEQEVAARIHPRLEP